MNKKFFVLAIVVMLMAAGCSKGDRVYAPNPDVPLTPPVQTQTPADTSIQSQPQQQTPQHTASQDVSYKGQNGKTALELLKAKYPVKTKATSYGDFVESINNITPDKNHFWSFYINGKLSNVGAGTYATKDSDQITWKLEEIKQ